MNLAMKLPRWARLIVVVFACSSPASLGAQAPGDSPNTDGTFPTPPRLDAAWTKSLAIATPLNRPVEVSVALSENGHCAAVAGAGTLEVLDSSGQLMWRWDYGKTNRLITPRKLAVAPSCNTIAMAGSPSYRYTWFADRQGHRVFVHTTSTPLGVAFDHKSQLVAIGTGGGDVLLLARNGRLKWKIALEDGSCCADHLSFSSDNRSILFYSGVLRLDGSVLWTTRDWGVLASKDLQTFVAWGGPNHGPGIGYVRALDASGNQMWSKWASGAVISPSGDKIVAGINVNQNPTDEDGFKYQTTTLQVLSRNGDVLKTLPVQDAGKFAISPDGKRVLVETESGIEGLDLNGNHLFEILLGRNNVLVSDDFSVILVYRLSGQDTQLQWYNLR